MPSQSSLDARGTVGSLLVLSGTLPLPPQPLINAVASMPTLMGMLDFMMSPFVVSKRVGLVEPEAILNALYSLAMRFLRHAKKCPVCRVCPYVKPCSNARYVPCAWCGEWPRRSRG